MAITYTTVRLSRAARDRLQALASDAEVSMGEVCESLSYARIGDLLRCGAARAMAEARADDAAEKGGDHATT